MPMFRSVVLGAAVGAFIASAGYADATTAADADDNGAAHANVNGASHVDAEGRPMGVDGTTFGAIVAPTYLATTGAETYLRLYNFGSSTSTFTVKVVGT